MAALSLKVSLEDGKVVKTMQFSPLCRVDEAQAAIEEKLPHAAPNEYGVFLAAGEESAGGAAGRGVWLEGARTLDYYMLRNGDTLHYARKLRNLRVRMLDGTVKTMLVDDSQPVANLMVVICTKIGITNHDEYGLVREESKEEEPERAGGTLTLRRRNNAADRDAKMDQLRRKLRTDDEVLWVEGASTLREQGVGPGETLLLRRRLFYSDRCVDARDPVQLTLLYVQARDAILDATHPVTQQLACEFAGIQCQVQFGDHKEDKHTVGLLDLKEFLPSSYTKVKGIEKKVFKEHATHSGLSELDAKLLYTQRARALPTYGVAFFLVKEKMKGKNKLVPRLLGVNKESVLRLDERTKEVLQTWPLTTVRRWCASPNTFTLDFGDYSDQYYSVQTTEAEQILQVIAGYIDLIVRRRRRADHLGVDGDEASAMLEDSVAPSRANIIQHDTFKSDKAATESVAKPAVLRPGADGAKPFAVVHTMSAQQTTVSGTIVQGHAPPKSSQTQRVVSAEVRLEPKRALLAAIQDARTLITTTEHELTKMEMSESERAQAQSVEWRAAQVSTSARTVAQRLAAMSAAAASVVTLTAGGTEEVDHSAVGAAVTTITTNMPQVTTGVSRMAALMPEDGGEKLLDATRSLCRAFSDLLTAAEPDAPNPRQSVLNAASRVGEASSSVLHSMGADSDEDRETQDIVLSLAKAAANAAAALVLGAKQLAARAAPAQQQHVVACAAGAATATSQLVATAKVVAPSLRVSACREQLEAAARAVAGAVERVLAACEPAPAGADAAHRQVVTAAATLNTELERLRAHCRIEVSEDTPEASAERVVAAGERVLSAAPTDVVRRARRLGQATAHLITQIKMEAEAVEEGDGASARRLLAAAKLLAEATARLVEAARQCAQQPDDRARQEAVRRAADDVREVAAEYARAHPAHGKRLAHAAAMVVQAATRLIDTAAQHDVLQSERAQLQGVLPRAQAAADAAERDDACTPALVAVSETMLGACGAALAACRPHGTHLAPAARDLTAACADLRSAVRRARAAGQGSELQSAARSVRSLHEQLDHWVTNDAHDLKSEQWSTRLASSGRAVCSDAAALGAAGSGGDAGSAARAAPALAATLGEFTRAAAAVSLAHPEPDRVVSSSREVVDSALQLIETVERVLTTTTTISSTEITTLTHQISQGVERCVAAAATPGPLDDAVTHIQRAYSERRSLSQTDAKWLQSELQSAAAALSTSAGWLGAPAPAGAHADAAGFTADAERLFTLTNTIAHTVQDSETVEVIERRLHSVVSCCTQLLHHVKCVQQDPTRPNAGQELATAARAVTDAINHLVEACSSANSSADAAAMESACAAAIRTVQASAPLLGNAPHSHQPYHSLLDGLLRHSKGLSEGMAQLAGAARRSEPAAFTSGVGTVADSAVGLVETAAHAAYLTGVSMEGSEGGRPGLVDGAAVARAAAAIDVACDTLQAPHATQQQVLSAATEIAKHTSALCAACRAASARSAEPLAKRLFVHAAKDVANATAHLVTNIKALDLDYSEENRASCAQATTGLRAAVRGLRAFADSPEFAAVPARIAPAARQAMQPLLQAGRDVISGTTSLLEAASVLASASNDAPAWKKLATHGQHLSDTVKTLVTYTREHAPGQRECGAALDSLEQLQRQLARACASAAAGELRGDTDYSSLQGHLEQVESSGAELGEQVDGLEAAARDASERLSHSLTHTMRMAESLTAGAIGAASALDGAVQASLLQHAQTVLEALAMLVRAARAAAGNPKAVSAQQETAACSAQVRAALEELAAVARDEAARRGARAPLLDSLSRAIARLTHNRMSLVGFDESASFGDYQARVTAAARDMARLAHEMGDGEGDVSLGGQVCAQYEALVRDAVCACAAAPTPDAADTIRAAALELGEAAGELVCGGRDRAAHRVSEKSALLLGALQAGARGSQACADAAAAIASVIQDLDTTILFASAGTLQSDVEDDSFAEHREGILRTAKALVEDTKALVGGAGRDQQALADAAMAARATLVELCSVAKAGAAALGGAGGGGEGQVLVLAAARDAAAALRDLCAATAAAAGRPLHSPHMQRLKHAAKLPRRWSGPPALPRAARPRPRPAARLSLRATSDSDTEALHSDAEDELIRLLDYSSQDDDISPSVFHDNCEEIISYVEQLMVKPLQRVINDDVNTGYNVTARNSLVDMDFRVLKYGENIFLGELRKYVDLCMDLLERAESNRKKEVIKRLKVTNELDKEMKRISQVIEDMDSEFETVDVTDKNDIKITENVTTNDIEVSESTVTPSRKPKLDKDSKTDKEPKLRKPEFKVRRVRPINLVLHLNTTHKVPEIKFVKPLTRANDSEETQIVESSTQEKQRSEIKSCEKQNLKPKKMEVEPVMLEKDAKSIFWNKFKDDSELWKALAKRHLEKMEETRRELEKFAGKELVIGDIDSYENEKRTLQSFIDDVDDYRSVNKDLEYDKKYEEMVLKLIEFAKKDFMFKGFDPLIEKLKALANTPFDKIKKHTNVQELLKIYTQIDITKYTYEELCVLEKYYEEIMRKYQLDSNQNIQEKKNDNAKPTVQIRAPSLDRDISRSPSLVRDRENTRSAPPTYHRNIILNIKSTHSLTKDIHRHSSIDTEKKHERSKSTDSNSQIEIFDLTRTYPMEYYANNWWAIYEDILQNREKWYGSMDNWWKFYETILNHDTTDQERIRLKSVIEKRLGRRREPSGRAQRLLQALDAVQHQLRETEDVKRDTNESVMVTNVTSLLKTVKAVEDEHSRGARALEAAIDCIEQEIEELVSPRPARTTATAEELARLARLVPAAAARAAGAGGRRDALTAAANTARRDIAALLQACKGAASTAESEEVRTRCIGAGRECAVSFVSLLRAALGGQDGAASAAAVAAATADLLHAADLIKGAEWAEAEAVVAESELLGAAAAVDAAADQLATLRAQPVEPQEGETGELEGWESCESALAASRDIVHATAELVRAAAAAQRDLVEQGVVPRRPAASSADGQWALGLVSAARLAAAAARALAAAAAALAAGSGSEERLVSSARQLASSTAQLLVACKVKAEPAWASTRRLVAAGARVLRAADALVAAARACSARRDQRSLVLDRRVVGGIAQEIDARSEVLRIEKELEEARGRLTAIRQAKYRLRGSPSGPDTDQSNDDSYTRGWADYTDHSQNSSSWQNAPNYTNASNVALHSSSVCADTAPSPTAPTPTTPSQHNNVSSFGHTNTFTHDNIDNSLNASDYAHNTSNYSQYTSNHGHDSSNYNQNSSNHGQNTSNYGQNSSNYNQNSSNYSKTTSNMGVSTSSVTHEMTSPSLGTFRPAPPAPPPAPPAPPAQPPRNYEGFTTRSSVTQAAARAMRLPPVRHALLVDSIDPPARRTAPPPPPPPRQASLLNYETKLYDAPRPTDYSTLDQQTAFQSHYTQSTPISPNFNARQLKFDDSFSYKSPKSPIDGVGQTFSERQKSTEKIPGGVKESEFSIKSESYSSYPKTEFSKTVSREEVKSPFATSTPAKSHQFQYDGGSSALVKASERVASPYGRTGPNFTEETTTEVKEIPNGTQKITTTKVYSSSPVSMLSSSARVEPVPLEGIDELAKYDTDSRYSTLDSRYNTLESKTSDSSRSFMRPSQFQSKSAEMSKELDSMEKSFAKQTITSETIERKSVVTSSHKSQTSSTTTKKFGNF